MKSFTEVDRSILWVNLIYRVIDQLIDAGIEVIASYKYTSTQSWG